MSSQYRRVVGDTETDIRDQLLADGSPVDISEFHAVAIHIETPTGDVIVADTNSGVTVNNSPEGMVRYSFSEGDLSDRGRYRYEWEVTFADGGVLTFPADGMAKIWVRDELS